MTTIIKTIPAIKKIHDNNRSIGLVATMGNLHAGHQSLLKRAREENDLVILSIFVNPTQFNDDADFDHYPRTLSQDIAIAKDLQIDTIFTPTRESLYPDDYQYQINESTISETLEGQHRPGHFAGVLTVVMKLLQITKPTRAYFGEKDYQQFQLIKGLCEAFFIDTDIIPCTTIREKSGLAMSSRNNLLSTEQRDQAAQIYQRLTSTEDCQSINHALTQAGFEVEYVAEQSGRRFVAAYLNKVRLIDNISI